MLADIPRLDTLREKLRSQMRSSPLFDPAQIARELEALYARLVTGADAPAN